MIPEINKIYTFLPTEVNQMPVTRRLVVKTTFCVNPGENIRNDKFTGLHFMFFIISRYLARRASDLMCLMSFIPAWMMKRVLSVVLAVVFSYDSLICITMSVITFRTRTKLNELFKY